MKSSTAPPSAAESAAAKAAGASAEQNDALYDRFALELTSMQVLIAPADVPWQSEEAQRTRKLHLINQFGLQLELKMCILPSGSHSLDQFIVTGALSEKSPPSP